MEELVVFCINCDRIIPANAIETHSKHCSTPIHFEVNPESCVNSKLTSYRNGLKEYLKSNSLDKKVRHVIKSCIKRSKQAEEISEDLKGLLKIVNRLDRYLEKYSSIVVMSLVDRLKSIIEEKGVVFIEKSRGLTERQNDEFDLTCRKGLNYMASDFFKCEKVEVEDWDSFTIGTMEVDKSCFLETENVLFWNEEEEKGDTMFQYFVTECLMCRLEFNYKHPAQSYSIHRLYRKSKEMKVGVDDWGNFIMQEFKQLDIYSVY